VNARRRVKRIQHLLEEVGLEAERIHMVNLSSAMANAFAAEAQKMTEKIQQLGPNPLRLQE
jgi:coenzyme F420-reducing hydrogenase delta subunit